MRDLRQTALAALFLSGISAGVSAQSVWTSRPLQTAYTLNSVTWTGAQLVAVSTGGAIITSPDGVTWTPQISTTTNWLSSVSWTGSRLVVVGYGTGTVASGALGKLSASSAVTAYIPTILTSPDGLAWTAQTPPAGNYALSSATWTGSQLVAVGNAGTVLTSQDGATWTSQNTGITKSLYSVTWTGLQLTAVGDSGTVLTSSNGAAWTARTSGTAKILNSVAWTGSQLVAVGNGGVILTSPDGITWTSQASGTSDILYSTTWTGSQLVVVGNTGTILTSPDGVTWTSRNSGTTNYLNSVTWTGPSAGSGTGQLVAVGQGTILTSPQDTTAYRIPTLISPVQNAAGIPGSTSLIWNASGGATSYHVQLSTNSNFTALVANDSMVTSTTLAVGSLLDKTVYYWRVNARNAGGVTPYSDPWSFSVTVPLPTTPILVSPAQNAVNVPLSINLTYGAVSNATGYRLQLSTNADFNPPLVTDITDVSTSEAVGPLLNNTVYYWRVYARNATGTGPWSAIQQFTTVASSALSPQEPAPQRLNLVNGKSLEFGLPQKESVLIQLFNSQGLLISRLLNETRNAGYYTVPLPYGLVKACYLLDFRAAAFHETMKIIP